MEVNEFGWVIWLTVAVIIGLAVGTGVYLGRRWPSRRTSDTSSPPSSIEAKPEEGEATSVTAAPKVVRSPYLELTQNGTLLPVVGDRCRIGRSGTNNIVLRDPSVSRRHAEIVAVNDGHFEIIDLDSMNGMHINHRRCRRSPLSDGDRIELGDALVYFRLLAEEAALPAGKDVKTVILDGQFSDAELQIGDRPKPKRGHRI